MAQASLVRTTRAATGQWSLVREVRTLEGGTSERVHSLFAWRNNTAGSKQRDALRLGELLVDHLKSYLDRLRRSPHSHLAVISSGFGVRIDTDERATELAQLLDACAALSDKPTCKRPRNQLHHLWQSGCNRQCETGGGVGGAVEAEGRWGWERGEGGWGRGRVGGRGERARRGERVGER